MQQTRKGMKWLVKSEVKVGCESIDKCWSFGSKSTHDTKNEVYTSLDILISDDFDYETMYQENPLAFLHTEEYFRLCENVVKHCENRRVGLVVKNLSDINDDIMDCVHDTYVKSREQFVKEFTTGGFPMYSDFIYLLSRTGYQFYDAYAYKARRELRNPSLDDIESFTDGHLVNSWSTFMKESSENYENFVTECKDVTKYVGGYQLSENMYNRLCENLDEQSVKIVTEYASALANFMDNNVTIPENIVSEFERIVTRVRRGVNKTEKELRIERNEKAYQERLLRQSQREMKRLETKRLASEKVNKRKEEKLALIK
jgi:hypothetical protein